MDADELRVVPKRDDATAEPDTLAHLSDLPDFMIADPAPDIRGWPIVLTNGQRVGKVEDVIVDTSDMTVRYLEVKLDRDAVGTDEETWRLVPVAAARLDDQADDVILDRLPAGGLASAPAHTQGAPTADQWRAVGDYYGSATGSPETREGGRGDRADAERRFWGRRRGTREGSAYLSPRPRRRDELPLEQEVVVEGLIVEARAVPADAAPPDGVRGAGDRAPGRSSPPDASRRGID